MDENTITTWLARGDFTNLEYKTHDQLVALYQTITAVYDIPILPPHEKNVVFIHNIRQAVFFHAIGTLKKKFTFTDDFTPLALVEDRSIEQRLQDGDVTLAMVKREGLFLYHELKNEQIVFYYGSLTGTRCGDKHTTITLYENLCARAGYQPKIYCVSLETITKLAANT